MQEKKHLTRIDIVIPVFNNSDVLENSIRAQVEFYRKNLQRHDWRIIIMDNASKDNTGSIGKRLSSEFPEVKYSHIPAQGRGIALRTAWSQSNADLLAYMDVDLATDLSALPIMLDALGNGAEVAVGSKYIAGSSVKRNWLRHFLSKSYSILNLIFLGASFTDAQCGFKGLRKDAATRLLPLIKDNFWFFDTELLYIAQKLGMNIKEVPVAWKSDGKSSVRILRTVLSFVCKLAELRLRRMPRGKPHA